ncbi:MAG: DUF4189 domain-containing protein [Pseudomonadota bacterium]
MALRWLFAPFVAVLTLSAFAVEGPRGGAPNAIDHLELAPRWADGEGSLLETGERSLGGGLEYSIDTSVCDMNFIDGASCGQVRAAIADALEEWSSGHPTLRFRDITSERPPAFPLAAFGRPDQGAEIDFFGSDAAEFPPFRAALLTGYTIFYERPGSPYRLTNGNQSRSTSRIESADVRFNAMRCYYIDTAAARETCVHFPSLVLHEVGHALGIGHPEDRIAMNLDSDDDPSNEMVIDCQAPSRGLKTSIRYDGASIALGRDVQGLGRWQRGLTWDDVAARDALYPHCGIQRLERFSGAWGAFSLSDTGATGTAFSQSSPDAAAELSLDRCQSRTDGVCRLVATFDGCFAYAEGASGGAGHAKSPRSDHARIDAVLACAENGGRDCRVSRDFCAFD